jgi:hypothetical protein
MLFKQAILQSLADGKVTLAFRRWQRPTVKVGGRVRTAAGVVRIGGMEPVEVSAISEADAHAAGYSDLAVLRKELGPDDGRTVYRIGLDGVDPDTRTALRQQSDLSPEERDKLNTRFSRWEKSNPGYFTGILKSVAKSPAIPAAILAKAAGVEKLKFKQDMRKLKELGLTESLDVGYRLSPRGEVVLRMMEEQW